MKLRDLLTELEGPPELEIPRSVKYNRIKAEGQFYYGKEGKKDDITGIFELNFPTEWLLELSGREGENRKWHKRRGIWRFGEYTAEEWQEYLEDIARYGIKSKIMLGVPPRHRRPLIYGGNHRVKAAEMLDLKTVPGELFFYGRSENEVTGKWKALVRELKRKYGYEEYD